jgi:hypothetical protein
MNVDLSYHESPIEQYRVIREKRALRLLNEMFNTTTPPRRHRVFTLDDSPFPDHDTFVRVVGRLPSIARTHGGRPVYRLTRPRLNELPNLTDNKPYWAKQAEE